MKTEYEKVQPYTTKDGSVIRELMPPGNHMKSRQSLAEATIPATATTILHRHLQSEEIYHILEGFGEMVLGDETFEVAAGDTVLIPAGAPHKVRNSGDMPLKILCCCSPPYSHADTELMDDFL